MAEGVLHVTDASCEEAVTKSKLPVLVDFWAAWCGPCQAVAPVIEELARDYAGRAVVAKVDTDANPALPSKFGISAIPTVILFKGGKEVRRFVGVSPKAAYAEALDKVVG